MLTERSEAVLQFFAAPVKIGRRAQDGAATADHPHMMHMRGSLTIIGYGESSKDGVDGIVPRTARLGTAMARDAYGWHDICFYGVEGNIGRASVVSMDDPVKAYGDVGEVGGDGRGPAATAVQFGPARNFFHPHAGSREATMAS